MVFLIVAVFFLDIALAKLIRLVVITYGGRTSLTERRGMKSVPVYGLPYRPTRNALSAV